MHVNQKPRRRHSKEFKAQVVTACAEPGASVSAVALSFGLNTNLVRQWRRGRGYKPNRTPLSSQAAIPAAAQFVALPLPAPSERAPEVDTARQSIGVEIRRGALSVTVSWPTAASADCAAWLRELLR